MYNSNESHQKLKKTSVNVSAHVNSANTIQYIIHLTWNQKDSRTWIIAKKNKVIRFTLFYIK